MSSRHPVLGSNPLAIPGMLLDAEEGNASALETTLPEGPGSTLAAILTEAIDAALQAQDDPVPAEEILSLLCSVAANLISGDPSRLRADAAIAAFHDGLRSETDRLRALRCRIDPVFRAAWRAESEPLPR